MQTEYQIINVTLFKIAMWAGCLLFMVLYGLLGAKGEMAMYGVMAFALALLIPGLPAVLRQPPRTKDCRMEADR